MPEYKEVQRSITIPKNTGKEGFLHTIGEILSLSFVQRVIIDLHGQITYKRMVLNGEEEANLNVDFDHVQPYHIIRNAKTREYLFSARQSAATVMAGMLDQSSKEGLTPIAFVVGAQTTLWSWYFLSTGVELEARDRLCGYTLYEDRHIPDTALVLCSGMGRTSSLVDTRLSVKAEMPRQRVLDSEVEIL